MAQNLHQVFLTDLGRSPRGLGHGRQTNLFLLHGAPRSAKVYDELAQEGPGDILTLIRIIHKVRLILYHKTMPVHNISSLVSRLAASKFVTAFVCRLWSMKNT
jgi:hypothetical protein